MKKCNVYVDSVLAGLLEEIERGKHYRFAYLAEYQDPSVSLTMPISSKVYDFDKFPSFFEGLLPEGVMLESLLKLTKIDRDDLLSQLIAVGEDLVGNVTVYEA